MQQNILKECTTFQANGNKKIKKDNSARMECYWG